MIRQSLVLESAKAAGTNGQTNGQTAGRPGAAQGAVSAIRRRLPRAHSRALGGSAPRERFRPAAGTEASPRTARQTATLRLRTASCASGGRSRAPAHAPRTPRASLRPDGRASGPLQGPAPFHPERLTGGALLSTSVFGIRPRHPFLAALEATPRGFPFWARPPCLEGRNHPEFLTLQTRSHQPWLTKMQ